MTQEASSSERRHDRREKMIGTGLMSWADGRCSMDCVVLDWTSSGARIQPADIVGCPEQFILVTKSGMRVPCDVRWREDKVIGVRFV